MKSNFQPKSEWYFDPELEQIYEKVTRKNKPVGSLQLVL